MLLGARAGDLLGRRRTFIAGIAVFILASLLGGFAPTGGLLLAARALQGVGGGTGRAVVARAPDHDVQPSRGSGSALSACSRPCPSAAARSA